MSDDVFGGGVQKAQHTGRVHSIFPDTLRRMVRMRLACIFHERHSGGWLKVFVAFFVLAFTVTMLSSGDIQTTDGVYVKCFLTLTAHTTGRSFLSERVPISCSYTLCINKQIINLRELQFLLKKMQTTHNIFKY